MSSVGPRTDARYLYSTPGVASPTTRPRFRAALQCARRSRPHSPKRTEATATASCSDPFGARLYTTSTSGTSLITLGDDYELRKDSSGTEARYRVHANSGKLVGELVHTGTATTRSMVFYVEDNVGSPIAETGSGRHGPDALA